MTRRSITALTVAAVMGMTACGGGGGSSRLSEDDFVDEVNDLCADAGDDLNDLDEPADLDGVVDFAADASDIFTTLREDLDGVAPPEDLQNDFDDALDSIDEIIDLLADLETAADDGDEEEAFSILDDIGGVSDDLEGLAEDLGVDDCNFEPAGGDAPATTDPPSTDAATTLPPETAPPTTAAPVTLPATTAPPATPAPTAPPQTEPDITADPETGALFEVVDLTTVFSDPIGFTLVDTGMDTAIPFISAVAAVPILNIGIDEMGVAAMIDSFGDSVGTLVVGVALEGFGMPEEWKTQLCTPATSEIRTTPAGYVGVYCPGPPGSGLVEIFTITEGDIGVSIGLVDEFYFVEDLIDAFLLANF